MDSKTYIQIFSMLRTAIGTLDQFEEKEITDAIGSYSHRIQRNDAFQIVDTVKIASGIISIITIPSENSPYTQEIIKVYLNNTSILEGELCFEQTDSRSELRTLKDFTSSFSKEISWGNELEIVYGQLAAENNELIDSKLSKREDDQDKRIKRKLEQKDTE